MQEKNEDKEENPLRPALKPNEIYAFNAWISISIIVTFYIIILIMPENFVKNLFGLSVFPQKYWFIAVPTHALTTLLGLSICVKGFELIKTIDEPPINDFFYHELPKEELMKEINYSPSEGILPDAGDINFNIVEKVRDMNSDEENDVDEN